MKVRVIKKRIRRYITWYVKHKIPKAFKDRRDRNEWIDYICKHHVARISKAVKRRWAMPEEVKDDGNRK